MGTGIVIKPGVKVKFPWHLCVGDYSWIGERAWIDNLGQVTIGSHVCISQGAYLCTGSHDWTSKYFDLIVAPITVSDHAWICANTIMAPGSNIGEGAVVTMSGLVSGSIEDWTIWTQGEIKPRRINSQ
jgi:putative colanic acid biosynthesis acetyltransferase WcaF